MDILIDKRDRANLFRQRLALAMAEKGTNQSNLARQIGVDRSTISQLLKDKGARLPNAQVVGECARSLGVSADWLLGLSEHAESAADVLSNTMSVSKAPRALADEQIFGWHQEAAGNKIRHVPATLPDMLKTPDMLAWEYAANLGHSAQQAIGASQDRLDWMRNSPSDYEIAMPIHEFVSFAKGEGYYSGLPEQTRHQQLVRISDLYDQLFPSMRLFLFDARLVWSAPITVFGRQLAVLFLGHDYLAFRDSERVGGFIRHFDWLVREATVSDRDIPDFIAELIADL